MAADQYGYNCVKMSGPDGVITLYNNFRVTAACVEQATCPHMSNTKETSPAATCPESCGVNLDHPI